MVSMTDILFFIHRLQSDMAARIAELEEELRRYGGVTSSLPLALDASRILYVWYHNNRKLKPQTRVRTYWQLFM